MPQFWLSIAFCSIRWISCLVIQLFKKKLHINSCNENIIFLYSQKNVDSVFHLLMWKNIQSYQQETDFTQPQQKGPINEFRLLLISVTHIQSASLLTSEDWQELDSFKASLTRFFESQGQSVCFVERNYKSSHLQINVIGVDSGMEWKIKHAFEVNNILNNIFVLHLT